MAAGVRELRRRIRGLKSMQQITKAMKMVAAARLLKAQERATAARPYGRKIDDMLRRVMAAYAAGRRGTETATAAPQAGPTTAEALMAERTARRVLYVVMTSDRGLSGSFNANLIKLAESEIKARKDVEASVFPVGRKGLEFFSKRGYSLIGQVNPAGDETSFAQARQIAGELTALFVNGKADEVNLVFSEFINAMTTRPKVSRLFPIGGPPEKNDGEEAKHATAARTEAGAEVEYIYEPSGPEVLNALLPRYVQVLVYRALL
ncbi:MAG: F0F1 ATP synthase subunit gamma, partial [Bacillota bacterium]